MIGQTGEAACGLTLGPSSAPEPDPRPRPRTCALTLGPRSQQRPRTAARAVAALLPLQPGLPHASRWPCAQPGAQQTLCSPRSAEAHGPGGLGSCRQRQAAGEPRSCSPWAPPLEQPLPRPPGERITPASPIPPALLETSGTPSALLHGTPLGLR